MVVQIVHFQLAGISPEQYEAHAERIAPEFARLPGLIAKAWLADPDENAYGGVYLWTDRDAAEAYAEGELLAGGPPEPGLRRLPVVDRRFPRCSHRGDRAGARRPIRREGYCVDLRGWDRRSAPCSTGRRLGSSGATASGPLCCASSVTMCRLPCSSTASPAWASLHCSRRSLRTRVSVAPLSCPWTRARSSRRNEASSTRSLRSSAASLGALAQVAAALGAQATRTVLAIDHYEVLTLLDDWIRQVLLPSVPDTSRLLLAGRDEPVSAWPSALGDLFEPLPLGNLRRDESEELLRRAGVAPADAARIDRIARGHPLSLRLSAAALANRPDLDLESLATGAVVDELTRIYLAGLDRETRRALDAASVVRRPTRALLAAMLDGDDADLSLDLLRRLPFVESDPDGLVLHDTVREAVAASLKATDPATYRRYRVAAWHVLRRELSEAGRSDLWRATADALYMLERPILRESFFPTGQRTHLLEPARADDGPGIMAIARRHETREAAGLIETWWEHAPASFRVARGRGGEVDAYVCVCDPDALPHRLAAGDPGRRADPGRPAAQPARA